METLARMYVWWPRLDTDIEETVCHCPNCQVNQSAPPTAPLHPWRWPLNPWTCIHIDFADSAILNGLTLCVLICHQSSGSH